MVAETTRRVRVKVMTLPAESFSHTIDVTTSTVITELETLECIVLYLR